MKKLVCVLIGLFLVGAIVCPASATIRVQQRKWKVEFIASDGNTYQVIKSDNTEEFLDIICLPSVKLKLIKTDEKEASKCPNTATIKTITSG